MAARHAAEALADLVLESGTTTYTHDVFGAGVFYRAFRTRAEARAFAREPVIDDRTTYSTGDRVGMCGEMAVGMLQVHPTSTIVVVDVVDANERCTLRHGADAIVQSIVLVPAPPELAIERLPEPIDDDNPTCRRIEASLNALFEHEGAAEDRRVYYIDARVDNLDDAESFDCITVNDDFSTTLATLQSAVSEAGDEPVTTPLTLQRVRDLEREHDPKTHVVAWAKMNDDVDVVWLVNRLQVIDPKKLEVT